MDNLKTNTTTPYFTFTMDRDGSTKLILHAVSFNNQKDLQLLIEMLNKIIPFLGQKEPG